MPDPLTRDTALALLDEILELPIGGVVVWLLNGGSDRLNDLRAFLAAADGGTQEPVAWGNERTLSGKRELSCVVHFTEKESKEWIRRLELLDPQDGPHTVVPLYLHPVSASLLDTHQEPSA
jgi:hypothetical protein